MKLDRLNLDKLGDKIELKKREIITTRAFSNLHFFKKDFVYFKNKLFLFQLFPFNRKIIKTSPLQLDRSDLLQTGGKITADQNNSKNLHPKEAKISFLRQIPITPHCIKKPTFPASQSDKDFNSSLIPICLGSICFRNPFRHQGILRRERGQKQKASPHRL